MRRQCFSTLRLRAIFSPLLVHTGDVSCSLAKSFFTAITLAPVDMDPMLSIRISPLASFDTFPCRSDPFVLTPKSRRSRKKFTCNRIHQNYFNFQESYYSTYISEILPTKQDQKTINNEFKNHIFCEKCLHF